MNTEKNINEAENPALNKGAVMPRFIYQSRETVTVVKMGKIWAEVKDEVGNTMHVLKRYLVSENGA